MNRNRTRKQRPYAAAIYLHNPCLAKNHRGFCPKGTRGTISHQIFLERCFLIPFNVVILSFYSPCYDSHDHGSAVSLRKKRKKEKLISWWTCSVLSWWHLNLSFCSIRGVRGLKKRWCLGWFLFLRVLLQRMLFKVQKCHQLENVPQHNTQGLTIEKNGP